jgi:predicted transcriptional regulator
MEAARAEEGKIIDLLRSNPMTAAEIGGATRAKATTLGNRLKRLEQRNLIAHGDDGRWSIPT